MKTDQFVDLLATGAGAIEPGYAARRFTAAVGGGTLAAIALMAVALGPRHDLAQALLQPMFWVKIVFVASLAALGAIGVYRLSRPAMRVGWVPQSLAAIVTGMWILAVVALARSDAPERVTLLFGTTFTSCPWLIAALSVPVFIALVWAIKGLAPTRLRWAGATAGFASGAIGALVYSIHCPELGAPFLATWYLVGILVPTAIGALLGERLFRW